MEVFHQAHGMLDKALPFSVIYVMVTSSTPRYTHIKHNDTKMYTELLLVWFEK